MSAAEQLSFLNEKVPKKVKLSYGLGSLSNGFLNGFAFANLQFFYLEKYGADPRLIGIAWLVFGVWNTLNDPIISFIIDNTRTKIGRRIPYIRYGSVFYGLAFIFCWFPIAAPGDQMGLFWNFLAALFVLDTMFTIVGCCFYCLPAEVALTTKERASVNMYGSIFGLLNTILGIALPAVFLTAGSELYPYFQPIMLVMGTLGAIGLFVASFGIKENMFAQLQPHEGLWEGIRKTFKNKPFWIHVITMFMIGLILPINSGGALYYYDYVIPGQNNLFLVAGQITGLIVGIFTIPLVSRKFSAKKASILSFIGLAIAFVIGFALSNNAMLMFIPWWMLGCLVSYAGMSVTQCIGDVIDNDELITGQRREAVYGGVNAIVTKPALSIANWLFLLFIDWFGFIKPIVSGDGTLEQQEQDSTAILGIKLAFFIVPAILCLISVISMKWYPLDGPEWLRKKQEIAELHEQKQDEFLRSLEEKHT